MIRRFISHCKLTQAIKFAHPINFSRKFSTADQGENKDGQIEMSEEEKEMLDTLNEYSKGKTTISHLASSFD